MASFCHRRKKAREKNRRLSPAVASQQMAAPSCTQESPAATNMRHNFGLFYDWWGLLRSYSQPEVNWKVSFKGGEGLATRNGGKEWRPKGGRASWRKGEKNERIFGGEFWYLIHDMFGDFCGRFLVLPLSLPRVLISLDDMKNPSFSPSKAEGRVPPKNRVRKRERNRERERGKESWKEEEEEQTPGGGGRTRKWNERNFWNVRNFRWHRFQRQGFRRSGFHWRRRGCHPAEARASESKVLFRALKRWWQFVCLLCCGNDHENNVDIGTDGMSISISSNIENNKWIVILMIIMMRMNMSMIMIIIN